MRMLLSVSSVRNADGEAPDRGVSFPRSLWNMSAIQSWSLMRWRSRGLQRPCQAVSEALLPLLEPMTARSWSCPYYQVKFDMSWVIWVLTSNNYHALPEPLLSRCPPIALRALTTDELVMFIWREGRKQGTSDVALGAAVEAFKRASRASQPSLRTAARVLQRAADLECLPTRHGAGSPCHCIRETAS